MPSLQLGPEGVPSVNPRICGRLVCLELLAKLCAKDFAVGVAGEVRNENELPRSLVRSEAGATVSHEYRFSEIAVRNYKGSDLLALRQFRESDRRDVLHSVTFPNYDFDLGRVHIGSPLMIRSELRPKR